jgi:sulfonate transport system substrate-binding protein
MRHLSAVMAILCMLIALSWVGSGCPSKPDSSPASAAGAAASRNTEAKALTGAGPAAATPVRLTYSEKACYAPVIVAVEEGYYKDEGLDIEPLVVTGGIESAEALISGQADLAVMGDAPTCIVMSRAKDARLVACQALGERMHRLVVRDDSGIAEPTDLEGKRIAVQLGSSTHGGLMEYLDANGVDASKVELVSLSPRDFPEAVQAKQVDGIAGSEPWPGNVMAACPETHELANFEGLGNLYPLPITGRGAFLDEHPEVAGAIIRATKKAVDLIASDPHQAAEIQAKASGLTAEREAKAMADYDYVCNLDADVLTSLAATAEFLKGQGKIDTIPDFEAACDAASLEALEQ